MYKDRMAALLTHVASSDSDLTTDDRAAILDDSGSADGVLAGLMADKAAECPEIDPPDFHPGEEDH